MAETDASDGKLTFHHMNHSQSQRIFWLLEELEIPYNLELHERQPTFLAPEELKKTHPLGKSPQLVTPSGRVITESIAIASYLIKNFDHNWKFKGNADTGNDEIRDDMLTSLAATSMGNATFLILFLDIMKKQTPFFIRPLVGLLTGGVTSAYAGPELKRQFTYLQTELGEQEYFMGTSPGRADFIVSWPVDMCSQRGYVNLEDYPKLKAWHERCQNRPAWKSALEKGNGYNLTIF